MWSMYSRTDTATSKFLIMVKRNSAYGSFAWQGRCLRTRTRPTLLLLLLLCASHSTDVESLSPLLLRASARAFTLKVLSRALIWVRVLVLTDPAGRTVYRYSAADVSNISQLVDNYNLQAGADTRPLFGST